MGLFGVGLFLCQNPFPWNRQQQEAQGLYQVEHPSPTHTIRGTSLGLRGRSLSLVLTFPLRFFGPKFLTVFSSRNKFMQSLQKSCSVTLGGSFRGRWSAININFLWSSMNKFIKRTLWLHFREKHWTKISLELQPEKKN